MHVSINEPGKHHALPSIDHPGRASPVGLDLFIRAHGNDFSAPDGDRLSPGIAWIDGVYLCVDNDDVRGRHGFSANRPDHPEHGTEHTEAAHRDHAQSRNLFQCAAPFTTQFAAQYPSRPTTLSFSRHFGAAACGRSRLPGRVDPVQVSPPRHSASTEKVRTSLALDCCPPGRL